MSSLGYGHGITTISKDPTGPQDALVGACRHVFDLAVDSWALLASLGQLDKKVCTDPGSEAVERPVAWAPETSESAEACKRELASRWKLTAQRIADQAPGKTYIIDCYRMLQNCTECYL